MAYLLFLLVSSNGSVVVDSSLSPYMLNMTAKMRLRPLFGSHNSIILRFLRPILYRMYWNSSVKVLHFALFDR